MNGIRTIDIVPQIAQHQKSKLVCYQSGRRGSNRWSWRIHLMTLLVLTVVLIPSLQAKNLNIVKRVTLDQSAGTIQVYLSHKPTAKTIQLDRNEFIIAFKDCRLANPMAAASQLPPTVSKLEILQLPRNVVGLLLTTHNKGSLSKASWDDVKRRLLIGVDAPAQLAHTPDSLVAATPLSSLDVKKLRGRISTLLGQPNFTELPKPLDAFDRFLDSVQNTTCSRAPKLKKAIVLNQKEQWQAAYQLTDRFISKKASDPCLEAAAFLKAFSAFKMHGDHDVESGLLQTIDMFKTALSYYPQSVYTPHASVVLGKMSKQLNNIAEARGYFKVVLTRYPKYEGLPEVMVELGKTYLARNKYKQAITLFERLLRDFPNSDYAAEAKILLGQALYQTNRFAEALQIYEKLLETDPERILVAPELLIAMGNIYYQSQDYTSARELLSFAYNYFPDLEDRHLVLTRLGDIHGHLNQSEKAISIYKLMIEKYPGTDGFIISSMRLADYADKPSEKEAMYQMILSDHPEHSMADLAMVKLARIWNQSGQYAKTIEAVRKYFSKRRGQLREEAIFELQKSYLALFTRWQSEGLFDKILMRYEKDKSLLKRFDKPELFIIIGDAYLKGHLYHRAAQTLQKAQETMADQAQPPDFGFKLGVAWQEAGQNDLAFEALSQYIEKYPNGKHLKEAHYRIGRIYLSRSEYQKAARHFSAKSSSQSKSSLDAICLIGLAESYIGLKRLPDAKHNLNRAIKLLAQQPHRQQTEMGYAYRLLGDVCSQLELHDKAAQAYASVLKFGNDDINADIKLLLADAYRNAQAFDEAEQTYAEIIAMEVPFWTNLAREKLREMKIKANLNQI